jgi:hypothetical protein
VNLHRRTMSCTAMSCPCCAPRACSAAATSCLLALASTARSSVLMASPCAFSTSWNALKVRRTMSCAAVESRAGMGSVRAARRARTCYRAREARSALLASVAHAAGWRARWGRCGRRVGAVPTWMLRHSLRPWMRSSTNTGPLALGSRCAIADLAAAKYACQSGETRPVSAVGRARAAPCDAEARTLKSKSRWGKQMRQLQ